MAWQYCSPRFPSRLVSTRRTLGEAGVGMPKRHTRRRHHNRHGVREMRFLPSLLFISFCFVGCTESPSSLDSIKDNLYGSWRVTIVELVSETPSLNLQTRDTIESGGIFILNRNGSGIVWNERYINSSSAADTVSFQWYVEGEVLHATFEDGSRYPLLVVSIDCVSMVLQIPFINDEFTYQYRLAHLNRSIE